MEIIVKHIKEVCIVILEGYELTADDIESEIKAGFVNWVELDYGQTFPIAVMTKEEIEDQDAAFLYDYLFLAEDPYDAFEEVNVDGVTYFQRKGK